MEITGPHRRKECFQSGKAFPKLALTQDRLRHTLAA
jgi:hypothetical protein